MPCASCWELVDTALIKRTCWKKPEVSRQSCWARVLMLPHSLARDPDQVTNLFDAKCPPL